MSDMVDFEDLAQLDGGDLRAVLGQVDGKSLFLKSPLQCPRQGPMILDKQQSHSPPRQQNTDRLHMP